MHRHEMPRIVDIALQNSRGDLAMVADGITLTLGIHGNLNVFGYGRVQDIVEVADDPVSAGFGNEAVKAAVGRGIGFPISNAALQFISLLGDGFFLFGCGIYSGKGGHLRLKDEPDIKHVQNKFVVIVDESEAQRIVGDASFWGDEGAGALPGLEYIAGGQEFEAFAQGAAADIPLFQEFSFGRQFIAGRHFIVDNIVNNFSGRRFSQCRCFFLCHDKNPFLAMNH